ncbi:MAG: DNA polymerase III subunit gamma/tau [Lachnospiraceae bacterium]|nr:DNA polymerase III subunit gamma/tau [Lachnospiraceae bacterium]
MYQALYRKWRPKTFDEVKGQDAVITTLKNQIVSGRIGHAYLFCGTRGTGKTSVAKIFARAVNCPNAASDGNPCNKCELCESILNESSMNVMEIDAASNNGVDNIRDIREQVQYPPTQGKYKVFIIDEVHMLSPGAFNALLKTLEEPPEYVIYILATTEVYKIPVTVLSRCQRYDFKRIPVETIVGRLRELTQAEEIKIEDKALFYIAKTADGAMRDALSLLDECVAFHPNEDITYDRVLEALGAADIGTFADLYKALSGKDTAAALRIVEDAVNEGKELSQFATDFLWFLRNLLVIRTAEDASGLIDASKDNLETMRECANGAAKDGLMRYIRQIAELINKMRYSGQKRVLLELALIRLMTPQAETDMEGVLARISELEEKLKSGNFAINDQPHTIIKKVNPRPAGPQVIRLSKAKYEDLMMLKASWEDIVEMLPGPKKVLMRGTKVEAGDDDIMFIDFDKSEVYNMSYRDSAIEELKRAANEKFGKEFTFRARLKTDAIPDSKYVTEEELNKLVKMEIEIEG